MALVTVTPEEEALADDKHYVGGDFYRIDDRSGFKVRASKTRKEWTNRIVRDESWEARQPQDFVQGVSDDQTVVDPRPRQINEFQGPLGTILTANQAAGSSFILVQSSVRMLKGDTLTIMLSTGVNFRVAILDILNDNLIQLAAPLPYSATNGSVVIDTSAVSNPVIVPPTLVAGGTQ